MSSIVQPAPKNSRLEWLDYTRGLGIFLVVLGHELAGLVNSKILENSAVTQFVVDWIYSFHMPLFFILSGLLAERSADKGSGKFATDKVRTIAYPYFVWELLHTCIQLRVPGYTNSPASWQPFLEILYLPKAQFWFLYVLFFCFFIYLGCRVAGLGRWGFLGVAVVMNVIESLGGFSSWEVLNNVGYYLIYFALGNITQPLVNRVATQATLRILAATLVGGFGLVTILVLAGLKEVLVLRIFMALLGSTATLAFASLLARVGVLSGATGDPRLYFGTASA